MKYMMGWVAVLLVGIAVIAVVPLMPDGGVDGAQKFFPEWLIPVGYVISGIGATGMFLSWVRHKG